MHEWREALCSGQTQCSLESSEFNADGRVDEVVRRPSYSHSEKLFKSEGAVFDDGFAPG